MPESIHVERWPSELPLRILVIFVSIGAWILLTVTIIGIIYALMLMVFFFFAHLAFIAHIRGNGVPAPTARKTLRMISFMSTRIRMSPRSTSIDR